VARIIEGRGAEGSLKGYVRAPIPRQVERGADRSSPSTAFPGACIDKNSAYTRRLDMKSSSFRASSSKAKLLKQSVKNQHSMLTVVEKPSDNRRLR
jgi:hypothetical protein